VSNNRQPYILITLYQNLYEEKYGKEIRVNKFREKWAMQDVIDSVGFDDAYKLLRYYFTLSKQGHPLQFFYLNFDKIEKVKNDIDQDVERRRLLREATKKMVQEESK
jgi:hypothetical protein